MPWVLGGSKLLPTRAPVYDGKRHHCSPSFLPPLVGGPQHGEHFRLEIFEGCNFTGQCLEFKDDCPFLQSQGWAKNWVNAIKVYGDGA